MQKNKLLLLTEILKQQSDAEHPITTNAMVDKLSNHGISCDRRTLARDISQLQDLSYPVKCVKIGHSNAFYLEHNDFSLAELKILIDAVQASSVIPEDMTNALIEKIANLGGTHCSDLLNQNRIRFNIRKQTNNSVLDTIAIIEESFKRQTQVSFFYFKHDVHGGRVYQRDKERYVVDQYKKKQMSKKSSAADEKRYTIREWDRSGKKCSSHEVYAISHLEALKKLYPDDTFELVPQSDIRNRWYLDGRGYDCEVSNHYGNGYIPEGVMQFMATVDDVTDDGYVIVKTDTQSERFPQIKKDVRYKLSMEAYDPGIYTDQLVPGNVVIVVCKGNFEGEGPITITDVYCFSPVGSSPCQPYSGNIT